MADIEIRTKFLDNHDRPDPKTGRYCGRCHKDLTPNAPVRYVYTIGYTRALHPDDVIPYLRAPVRPYSPTGWFPLGAECAQIVGLDWSLDPGVYAQVLRA